LKDADSPARRQRGAAERVGGKSRVDGLQRVIEREISSSQIFATGRYPQQGSVLLGVERGPINQNLPTVSFGHGMKNLPAFQRSP